MKVVVVYRGKTYHYKEIDNNTMWVDANDLPVSVKLHSMLREQALESGVDPSIFISNNKIIPKQEPKLENNKAKTKTKLQGSINPFK